MPIPALGLGATVRSDNPLCCVGCCSSGDVDVNVGRGSSSGNVQENQDSSGDANLKTVSELVSDVASNASDDKNSAVVTTQPKSISSLMQIESTIEQQVDDIAISILRSERSGRCCTAIYDACSPRCTAPCGNPTCGCSEGECGCGSFGRLLCGMFDACCVVGAEGSKLKLSAWHRGLRQIYDPVVIGLAEKQTGISLQDLLIQGRAPTTKEKEQMEAACAMAHSFLTSALGDENVNSWKKDQDKCISLLEDGDWEAAVNKTLSCEASNISPISSNLENVLVVSQEKMSVGNCEPFSVKNLGKELSNLKVSTGLGVYGVLGVSEATIIAQIIAEIIKNHPGNHGNFWLTRQVLRYLVCLVLSIRNLSFINTEGEKSRTSSCKRIRDIRSKCQDHHSLMLSCSTLACIDLQERRESLASLDSNLLNKETMSAHVASQLLVKYQEAKDRLAKKGKSKEQSEVSGPSSYSNDVFVESDEDEENVVTMI